MRNDHHQGCGKERLLDVACVITQVGRQLQWVRRNRSATGKRRAQPAVAGELEVSLHVQAGMFLDLAAFSISFVQIFAIQQVAMKRLYDGVDFPLGPTVIVQKMFDARPADRAVEFTVRAFVKELTVLLTDVFLVLLTVFDFHPAPPFCL